jgi:uncharacterized SAM-binding protein YcdF (DUF218 family)
MYVRSAPGRHFARFWQPNYIATTFGVDRLASLAFCSRTPTLRTARGGRAKVRSTPMQLPNPKVVRWDLSVLARDGVGIATARVPPLLYGILMGLVEQLARLSHPILQAEFLAVLGVLLLRRHRRVAIMMLSLATLWIGLCSTPAFAVWLQQGLERPYVPTKAEAYPKADVIVVLGGDELPQSGTDWGINDAEAQTTSLGFGLQLFRSSRADTILLSGNDQALQMTRLLQEQGVPASALITEDASANTHQNALYSAVMLKRKKLLRVLLVTSGIHMKRATASFIRQGLTVIPARSFNDNDGLEPVSHPWWPKRAALSLSAHCLREYLGLWAYRLYGWA